MQKHHQQYSIGFFGVSNPAVFRLEGLCNSGGSVHTSGNVRQNVTVGWFHTFDVRELMPSGEEMRVIVRARNEGEEISTAWGLWGTNVNWATAFVLFLDRNNSLHRQRIPSRSRYEGEDTSTASCDGIPAHKRGATAFVDVFNNSSPSSKGSVASRRCERAASSRAITVRIVHSASMFCRIIERRSIIHLQDLPPHRWPDHGSTPAEWR